jgi:phage baseplate assembly protein W|tara:strand:+ start:1103 stop:1519 length:417 start_codon:yes stop_codon:yes gene_type:complete
MSVIENDLNEDTYIGLELPLTHNQNGFFNRTKTALQQAKSNIKFLLLTKKGERLGMPTFGSELFSVIFEQEDDVESRLEEAIRSAISEWLPFIIIKDILINFSSRNLVNVNIKFTLNIDTTSEAELNLDLSSYKDIFE